MRIHLVDGTYELFRHYLQPSAPNILIQPSAMPCAACSAPSWACWPTASRISAWPPITSSSRSAIACGRGTRHRRGCRPICSCSSRCSKRYWLSSGVMVWPMVELEADDALASAAAVAAEDAAVDQVAIWTPDKDLGQCVQGNRVVQVDRRSGKVIDREGVIAKFGVPPEIDSRLACARRRQRRWVPRPPGLGRQVIGHGARALRTHREHPCGRRPVGGRCAQLGQPRCRACRATRQRVAVP